MTRRLLLIAAFALGGIATARVLVLDATSPDEPRVKLEAAAAEPEPETLHHQDWGEYAIGDLPPVIGVWDGVRPDVVSGAPLGTDKALRIRYNGGSMLVEEAGWPAPAVGDTIAYHFLLYSDLETGWIDDHGIQSNVGQISQMWLINGQGGENTFMLGYGSYTGEPGGGVYRFDAPNMPKRTPLRVEWRLIHEPGPRVTADIRVTNVERGSRWTTDDFLARGGEGPETMTPQKNFRWGQVSDFRALTFGTSGPGRIGGEVLIADLRVCTDWCVDG